MKLTLPWPPRELSPNARVHWAVKSKAAKSYRTLGSYAALLADAKVTWDGVIHAFITFYPPDKRQRDDDNLIASFKSARDGIADALGVDDKRFRIHPYVSEEVRKGGVVEVVLTKRIDKSEVQGPM
jgi:crossover junction endodeoxyribonuclease RusA